jgi:hypothetical protein
MGPPKILIRLGAGLSESLTQDITSHFFLTSETHLKTKYKFGIRSRVENSM